MNFKPMKLTPVYKDLIWGGDTLATLYGKPIPTSTTGESWEASCIPESECTVCGERLDKLIAKDPESILGFEGEFGLLFKLIDAKNDLSVQVHPNDEQSLRLEGQKAGKTECWYVVAAEPGASLVLGFEPGVTKADFEREIKSGGLSSILKKVQVFPGDFFFIPAGTVHAIGSGVVIAELQQPSAVTYRVFDYNRKDANGNERPLHVEKALEVSDVCVYEGVKITQNGNRTLLAKCPFFSIEKVECKKETENTNGRYKLVFFEKGSAKIITGDHSVEAAPGDTFLIPAIVGEFTIEGECTYLYMDQEA